MELYQALAIFVMLGGYLALTWFFSSALHVKSVSINFISYELLLLVSIVFGALFVDFSAFSGSIIIDPVFGAGMANMIRQGLDSMGYDMRSYVSMMMFCVIISVSFVFYYLFIVKPEDS